MKKTIENDSKQTQNLEILIFFKQLVFNSIEGKPSKVKGFIINARAINYIDSTASEELVIIIKKLQKKGIRVMVVGAIDPSRDIIINSKLIKVIKKVGAKI